MRLVSRKAKIRDERDICTELAHEALGLVPSFDVRLIEYRCVATEVRYLQRGRHLSPSLLVEHLQVATFVVWLMTVRLFVAQLQMIWCLPSRR